MRNSLLLTLVIIFAISLLGYSIVGTSTNVDEIKRRAPLEMKSRNWKILRYEGFQYGSWSHNGGKVWYHVANIDDPRIQYRVFITLWDGELQYTYGEPEVLTRVDLNYKN